MSQRQPGSESEDPVETGDDIAGAAGGNYYEAPTDVPNALPVDQGDDIAGAAGGNYYVAPADVPDQGAAQVNDYRPLTPPRDEQWFNCAYCEKSFSRRKTLKRHVTKCHVGRDFAPDRQERDIRVHCRVCVPFKSISKELLGRHMRDVHDMIAPPNEIIQGFWGHGENWEPIYSRRGVPVNRDALGPAVEVADGGNNNNAPEPGANALDGEPGAGGNNTFDEDPGTAAPDGDAIELMADLALDGDAPDGELGAAGGNYALAEPGNEAPAEAPAEAPSDGPAPKMSERLKRLKERNERKLKAKEKGKKNDKKNDKKK